MNEPKYDEDIVNLGYLKRALGLTDEEAKDIYKFVSRHYASKPQPPYYAGDTWIDGDIIYTCINDRLIGTYQDSDWVTESGAKREAEEKSRVFLRQPDKYKPGDMWILQSDNDHRAGKKGEILIATTGRLEYDEDDWVNMLGYGTIRSINEVANNINDALIRLGLNKENGILTIFYSEELPSNAIENDLWYVTEELEGYLKGKIYKYNNSEWELIEDELAVVAFDEANEARLVADGKIQSFYSNEEPTQNVSVGDIWTDTNNNKLYRYNGTKWLAVYDTNISEIRISLNTVTSRTTSLETDLGNITGQVTELETTTRTIENELGDVESDVLSSMERIGTLEINATQIRETVSEVSEEVVEVAEQTELNTDEIARLGSTDTVEGEELNINASNNPAKMILYGNTEQSTTRGINKLDLSKYSGQTHLGITSTINKNKITCTGTATSTHFNVTPNATPKEFLPAGTYTFSIKNAVSKHVMFVVENENGVRIDDFRINAGQTSAAKTYSEPFWLARLYCAATSGETINLVIEDLMVEPGSTVSPFEEYSGGISSPNPNYPARIRNVGDNINRFDINNISSVNGYLDTQGRIYSGGTRNEKTFDFMKANPNETYTFTLEETTDNTADGYWFGIGAYSNNNESSFISMPYRNTSTTKNVTFTTPAGTKYIRISGRYLAGATKLKLVEGSTIFPYTQYNCGSADYLLQNDNLLKNTSTNETLNGVVFTTKDDGTIIANGTATSTIVKNIGKVFLNAGMQYYLGGGGQSSNVRIDIRNSSSQVLVYTTSEATQPFQLNTTLEANIYIRIQSGEVVNNVVFKPIISKNLVPYIPHEEYTIHFPFAEGQLLHKGDYLAEDGIHQKKFTYKFTGNENASLQNNGKRLYVKSSDNPIMPKPVRPAVASEENNYKIYCNCLKQKTSSETWVGTEGISYDRNTVGGYEGFDIAINGFTTLQQYLDFFEDNDFIIEYELAQEVIIPYTPEQEKALDEIYTFKGNNYIYCIDEVLPKKIVLTYYPNTPYNDTLVNKDTFDKVTSNMSAEFNIRAGEIESKVTSDTTAQIITLLNNGYLTAEQVNALVNGNSEDIATVKQQLTQTVTSSEMQIAITSAIEGGVSYLKNTLFTIDEDGMWIATSQDEFNARYNNRGMYLYSYEDMIASFDVNGSVIHGNLTLEGELLTPNLRMMNTSVNGVNHTHIHWIGG